ncbi:TPA: hypothetical protein DE059_02080 [Candidatus Peribacteria bacterium]|nr:hypothetical protein [Candidatus Peribacteria bacterium]|tara:strand:- start:2085 stop:3869 length:1785 start_codon:yes stop_codon:yes gene_type:complete
MLRIAKRTRILASIGVLTLVLTAVHSIVVQNAFEGISAAIFPECSDGIDNDVDGIIDYPFDHDCDSPSDLQEGTTDRDLYLTISDGLEEINTDDNATYTIGLRTDSSQPELVTVRFYKPQFSTVTTASENGRIAGNTVIWKDTVIHPGYVKELFVNIHLNSDAREGDLIIAEAYAGDIRVTDATRVHDGNKMRVPMEVFVDDGKIYAEPDEILTYQVLVKNTFGEDREFTLRTQLPPPLHFMGASGEYKRTNRSVEWENQFLPAGGEALYELKAQIDRETTEFGTLRVRFAVEAAFGTDTTTILYEELPPATIDVGMTDGYSEAKVGELLTYAINIKNNQTKLVQGVDVKGAIPMYAEFVDASEGGYWNGQDVFWKGVTVSPHGSRTLLLTVRVRRDAPLGAIMRGSVSVEGRDAVDQTVVSDRNVKSGQTVERPMNQKTLLRKVADRHEVRPGDTVRYSIYLKNTYDHPIRNVRIEDRIDSQFSEVSDAQQGVMEGDRIVWNVPVLNPGEGWEVHYTVRVFSNVPHGMEIANIVSVNGEGLESISLSERVRVGSVGVVTKMPKSGAPLDVIFASLMAVLSGVPTILIRRRYII